MRMECTRVKLALTCLGLITIVLIQILYISSKLGGNCDIKEIFLRYNVAAGGGKYDVKSLEIPDIDRSRRFPDALIIGVRKGGTRALLDAMALHPSIKAARREVHFFDQNETYSLGIEWYRQQMPFSHPGQLTVEKTPAYFASSITPSRVHQLNKNMKLIVILRDPVIRTISDFTQVLYTKLERNKTQPIFENVAFLPNSTKINPEFKPIRNSLYYLHLKNWLKYFPLENFLFLNGEKFVNNPLSELRKVERFFNLSNAITDDQLFYNPIKGFYCFRRKEKHNARCLGSSKGRAHVPILASTKKALSKNFRQYNEKFFKLINQRFNWT